MMKSFANALDCKASDEGRPPFNKFRSISFIALLNYFELTIKLIKIEENAKNISFKR